MLLNNAGRWCVLGKSSGESGSAVDVRGRPYADHMSAAEVAPREPEANAWAPDPWQQAVLDRALSGLDATVVGGPGSGKTSVLGAISSVLEADDRVLVLSQSRQRAAAFNDRYLGALRGVRRGSLAVTPVALAFAIVSGRALQRGMGSSPRLLSGSEQDRLFAELLRGEVSGEVPQAPWPASVPPQTRALTGFRTELRDLYMRCVEHGVTPERLHRLADRHSIPVWHAAAEFFRTYADVKAATFRFGEAWDSSELLQQASALLEQEELPERLAAVRWLLIDDTQDITPAAGRLLRALARPEMTIVACGDPDVAVNSFRGGSPAMAVRLLEDLGRDSPRLLLRRSHRLLPAVREDARRVVGGIGVAGETAHRLFEDVPGASGVSGTPGAHTGASAALGAPGLPGPAVRVRLAPGGAEEGLLLAGELRAQHLLLGVPWGRMAVVTRSAGRLPELAADLEDSGVPVTVAGVERPLRDHPLVWELLQWVSLAARSEPLTAGEISQLLAGELVGFDALELRRLKHALREQELAEGGDRTASELLTEGFAEPERFRSCGSPGAARAARAAALFHEVSEHLTRGASAPTVLWAIWAGVRGSAIPGRSALGDTLQRRAREGGPEAAGASAALDAVLGLFAAAERYAERFPSSRAHEFVHSMLEQSIPEDTLAVRESADSVVLATPAAVAGREFDFVAIAGVQDGVWPNLRIRGTLLHGPELPQLLAEEGPLDPRRQVLDDELRFFYTALTRSRGAVLLTAVDQGDDFPSPFLHLIGSASADPAPATEEPGEGLLERLSAPLTLRGLAAQLRRRLAADPASAASGSLARALRRLALSGVPEADPDRWAGVLPAVGLSLEPPRSGILTVSPSALESFERDPAGWFLNSIRARPAGASQGIGTLVHRALQRSAEEANITLPFLRDQVREGWGELEFSFPWEGRERWEKVEQMLILLQEYLRGAESDGWAPVAVEQEFRTRVGEAELHGFIDRIERNREGQVRIIDLKTGRMVIPAREAPQNLQLASYQIALADPDFPDSAGGELADSFLLYVGAGGKSAKVRRQEPQSPEQRSAFLTRISGIARGMASGEYPVAQIDDTLARDSRLLGIPEVTE